MDSVLFKLHNEVVLDFVSKVTVTQSALNNTGPVALKSAILHPPSLPAGITYSQEAISYLYST